MNVGFINLSQRQRKSSCSGNTAPHDVTKMAKAFLSEARRWFQFSGDGKVFIAYRQNGHTINRWGSYEKLSRPSTQEKQTNGVLIHRDYAPAQKSMVSMAVNVALNVALNWLIALPSILIWPHLTIISLQARKKKKT